MLKVLFYCYYSFVLASFLISFLVLKQAKVPLYIKLFCPFLGITIGVDAYALYLVYHGQGTQVFYSIFNTMEFAFYLFVLSSIIINVKVRLIIRGILIANALFAMIDMLVIQKNTFATYSYL